MPGSGDGDPGKTVSRYYGGVKQKLDREGELFFHCRPLIGNEKVRAFLCDLCASAVKSAFLDEISYKEARRLEAKQEIRHRDPAPGGFVHVEWTSVVKSFRIGSKFKSIS